MCFQESFKLLRKSNSNTIKIKYFFCHFCINVIIYVLRLGYALTSRQFGWRVGKKNCGKQKSRDGGGGEYKRKAVGPTCKILHEFGLYTEMKFAMRIHTHTQYDVQKCYICTWDYIQQLEGTCFIFIRNRRDFVHLTKGGM